MSRFTRYTSPDLQPQEQTPEEQILDERPSKSSRKRAAHAAQALGERLIQLKESEWAKLPLPETLLDALRTAKRIKARGGLARQKQYIGKLMRELDTAAIEAALEDLG
jgi:ribosome-associated protein